MAKVIDARSGGGEIVLLGTSVVLPIDDQDASVREPMNASLRFNPTTDEIEAFLDVNGTWDWCSVVVDRGSDTVLRASGAQMVGDLTMLNGRVLIGRGTAQMPGLAFQAQSTSGLCLDPDGNPAFALNGALALLVKTDGLHVTNTVQSAAAIVNGTALTEIYEADVAYPAGTVVSIGGNYDVTTSASYAETQVAGVVTGTDGYTLNGAAVSTGGYLVRVATRGRVPCKVIGPINKGDLLCTSANVGYAQSYGRGALPESAILGRALQALPGNVAGTIMIKV